MRFLILSLSVWTSVSFAAKIENHEFPEEKMVGTQKYVLNGVALRSKKKIGMNFKVYIGALYVASKTADAAELIKSPQPKLLEMVFLREVDRETLQDAWSEGFKNNCKEDCKAAEGQFKAFNDLMADVQEESRITMTFEKTSVNVDVKGAKKSSSAMIVGEEFRRAALAIFIGDKPPTPEFKKGLMGQPAK